MTDLRIGIDLGTTNTVAAMVYDDGPHVMPRGQGRLIPSTVYFRWDQGGEDVVVGEEAERWMAEGRVVRSVKRLMGRTHAEALAEGSGKYFSTDGGSVRLVRRGENDLGLEIEIQGRARAPVLWPHEVSAWVLREAKGHAERSLGRSVDGATVTVPAYFRDPHRAATLDAARQAGLEVFGDLLDEPTAAALAFAPVVGFKPGEPVLVVDWGGGTLDVTVQLSRGAEWFQAAIGGDLTLGGDDLDRALAEWALARAGLAPELLRDEQNRWMLLRAARQAKERLSLQPEATLACPKLIDPATGARLKPLGLALGRADFEEAIATLLDQALACVAACLDKPDVDREGVRKVLLVGGSTGIPAFRRRLARLLPQARLHDEVDAMQAVALGAAIYAHRRPDIARICPYGYAVLDDDGGRLDVIPPDTEVPTAEHLRFAVPMKTRYTGQTVYRLTLASFAERAGQRAYHDPQRLFARGVPPSAAETDVDVELWLDENKTLRARCHLRGQSGSFALEGREEGDQELFTRLFNATLEGEAVLEANQRSQEGLLPSLRKAVEWAKAVDQSRDRAQAESVLQSLTDLGEQVLAGREALLFRALPAEEVSRQRVEEWIDFYERSLLPTFWEELAGVREKIIERIRALRVKVRTGAPPEDLDLNLVALKQTIVDGELEPALQAWYQAGVLGVPERLSTRLREQALAARDHFRSGEAAALAADLEALRRTLAEADATWRAWRATGPLLEASPDLVVVKTRHDQAN
ncbi:MAG TPA: Hsp70 family protein [Vicinamibacteria bacterium]